MPQSGVFFENHGLVFRAPFPPAGVATLARPPRPPEVEIGLGPTPASLGPGAATVAQGEVAGAAALIAAKGVGRFLVEDGARITAEPAPGGDPGLLRGYLYGLACGALLQQRGMAPLHAGCVARGRAALALVGASGAGKSTTAAHLCRRGGYRLICDDVVTLDWSGDFPAPRPSTRATRLWDDAAAALGLAPAAGDGARDGNGDGDGDGGLREHAGVAKRLLDPPPAEALEGNRLAGVLALTWLHPPGAAPELRRVEGVAALALLRRNLYAEGFVGPMGREPDCFAALARLAAAVPVHWLARPRSVTSLPAVLEAADRVLEEAAC